MFRYFENLVDPYCDYPETNTIDITAVRMNTLRNGLA